MAQPNPVSWSANASPAGDGTVLVELRATIDPGWHIYDLGPYDGGPTATSFTFVLPEDVELIGGVRSLLEPRSRFDDMFGMRIGFFEANAVFVQKVRGPEGAVLQLNVEWMCCNDGSCLPPADESLEVVLPDQAGSSETSVSGGCAPFWSLILQAIAWGLAALLTPCVFPMVPMTVSYFIKGDQSRQTGHIRAFAYGLSIVLLYTLPIVLIILITREIGGETVTTDIFNWLATHWLPNIIFFIVFMLFALSFFGVFEIVLPNRLVNSSDRNADRKGLGGIFFMALTLVLVSFSCTGPIVGTVLIKSTSGEFWAPMVTMLAFSLTFALPFTLLAMFPSWLKKLPKSGGWLNTVKVSLGFIEIALGFKFLSTADQTYQWGILGRRLYLCIWIACFTLLGLYLLGVIRFRLDGPRPTSSSGVPAFRRLSPLRILFALASFAFVGYMLPGLWGAPLKALSGYLPPQKIDVPAKQFTDLDEAEAFAESSGKPLFIDFSGLGCVNCREMEARVLSETKVRRILSEDYVTVTIYGDDKTELPEDKWVISENGRTLKTVGKVNSYRMLKEYGISAQPYYILWGHGRLLAEPRAYDLDADAFRVFLEDGLASYNHGYN